MKKTTARSAMMRLGVMIMMAFCMSPDSWGQTTLFQFDFENSSSVTLNNTIGIPKITSSNGINPTYSTNNCSGSYSYSYSSNNWQSGDNYQFSVNTVGFYNLTFSYCDYVSGNNFKNMSVQVSTDGIIWTTVTNSYSPSTNSYSFSTHSINLPSSCDNNPNVFIQIYKYDNQNTNKNRTYCIDNVTLTGNKIFYSKGNLTAQTASSWNTKRDGTGIVATTSDFTSGSKFIVQNGHNMNVSGTSWNVTGTNSAIEVENGGALNCNSTITGTASFTLDAGATLGIGDAKGITSTANSGSIQVSGTRTYDPGANYNYIGSAAQVTGNGLPSAVNNLTVNNAAGLTLLQDLTVNNLLTLQAGNFSVAGNTLTLNGSAIAGTPTNLATTNSSTLVFGGSSSGITIPSSVSTLNSLTINNANGVSLSGPLSLGGTASVALTLTSGVLNTSATNLLTIINSATGSIGVSSGYINGPLARTLLAKRNAAGTYLFPVGDGTNYRPLNLVNVTTGTTPPVVLVSETATGALNGDETTITGIAPRNWYVQNLSGNYTSGVIQLTENGLGATNTIGQSVSQSGNYSSVGGSSIGTTISTSLAILNSSLPAYFAIGTSIKKTYYSYQSGDWNSANTWTIDPSGTLWEGAAVPTAADNVVILNGRTVEINQNGKNCNSLEIRLGGILDLNTTSTHNFGTVIGQGTLKLSSGNFPGGIYTDFVAAGGGTVQYYDFNGNMSSQAVYNNLIISNSTSSTNNIVLPNASNPSNYTINGNLTIQNTGSGSQQFTIGNSATNIINFNEFGNVNVGAGCSIRVGNYNAIHNLNLYGDLINNGSVRFTNQSSPVQLSYYTTSGTTTGAAIVTFMGGTDNSLKCNGTTDFYRLIIDKGTDQTYTLDVTSSNTANFALYAPNNQGGNQFDCGLNCFGSGYYQKALYIAHGTLKLNDNINIPSLTEGGQDFNILPTAALWINGATVSTTVSKQNGTDYQAATLYGKLRISSGSFSTGDAAGIVLGQSGTPDILVEGTGILDVSQVWTSDGSNIMSYTQTGGTTNIRANGETHNAPMLSLTSTNCVFNMSGGSLNFTNGILYQTQGIDIQVAAGKYSVTGGTVNINYPGGVTCDINSTVPFYNFNVSNQNGTGTTTVRLLNTSSSNFNILNNLTLNSNTILNSGDNSVDVTVGGNFAMDAAATYTPGNNTTTFNGQGGQVFTNAGTITTGLNNFVLSNTSNTDITNNLVVRNALTINSNCFLNDQGNTINVAGNVINSGTHTSQANGAIILNGTTTQVIGGSGGGIFGNFTVNKTAGTSSLAANQMINGNLRLVRGILDINTYNLKLSANSNIYDVLTGTSAPTTFGNTKMITTSGQQSDGGLTKTFGATGSFLYPVGTGTAYHPGTIAFSQAPSTWGDITVKPVAKAHPFAITGNQVLNYYWKVVSNSITGIQPGSVSHTYHYVAADAGSLLSTYVTGVYNPYAWTSGSTAQVDKINNNILFPSINIVDGEYTAGVPPAFGPVLVYYSRQSGDWDDQNTWSNVSNSGPVASTKPTADNPVVIGDGAAINHVVTITSNAKIIGGLQINCGSTLDVGTSTGHNFGALPDLKIAGTGTLRISSSSTTATFPKGDFGNFLGSNGGTVEYYTQTAPTAIGSAFTLPTTYTSGTSAVNISNYCNLILSPAVGQNITMPNTNLVVYKDFNVNVSGTSTTGIAQFTNQNTTRTVTINGNLNVNKGDLQFTNGNSTAQNLVVTGDVNVASGATFDVASSNAATNTMSIQGNLMNNGTFNMVPSSTQVCNVTFTGADNKQISGTTALSTAFNILTVNKGTDRNSILEVTVNKLSLNTSLPTALTLTNGTFRLSSPIANPITITLTTNNPFTIPNTGCLSANIGTINIGAANGNYDLILQGRLEVMNSGVVNIGNGSGSANDIEYSPAGNPEINVSGGFLNVDGQIRRNTQNTLGALWFNQSGGTITVKGNNYNTARGIFEVLNTGSQFNVSGGNLIIQTAETGTPTFADVLITPDRSSDNNTNGGHTLIIGNASTPASSVFNLDIAVPLWNLTIDGTTQNKTASLSVNNLSILNNLTINGNGNAGTGSVFKANDLDVKIGGSLINNNLSSTPGVDQGGYQAGAAGSVQNTTFTGTGNITGTGTNLTNFANLLIGGSSTTPAITLGSNSNLQVNNDLTLTSGTLADAGNTITVLGNIDNSAIHSSPLTPGGGIVLANGTTQVISGNGNGSFGNITINNPGGVNMIDNTRITGQLNLSGGLLYIDDYKLTMDVNSSFAGTFNASHMIKSNGVISDEGVQKLFSGSTSAFVFPIGTDNRYRPAAFSFTTTDPGSVKVVPVASAHPSDNPPTNDQLNYYWKTTTNGFSGLSSATQTYYYKPSDVTGNESNYHGAHYSNYIWDDYGSSVINVASHTINISRSDFLSGEYTAGEQANFSNKPPLYSVTSGNWSDGNNWSINPTGTPVYGSAPNGNPVFIQAGHKITMDKNQAFAYSVNIVGTLDIGTTAFHNLGYITDTLHARTGRIMLQSTPFGMFLFPGGNYDSYMSSTGTTVELYGTNDATLPLKPGNNYKPYQNLDLTGTGIKYMSADNLKILGNLKINDGAKLSDILFNKELHILGNWTDYNTSSSGFVPGSGFVSIEGNKAQTLTVSNALTENFYDLKMNNLNGLVLAGAGNVQVSDILTLNTGNITTNTVNSLTLTSASTSAVVGGSLASFINGPLRKQINNGSYFTFPVGKTGTTSRYGNLYLSTVVNSGIWESEYYNAIPPYDITKKKLPISHVSNNEYWRINGVSGGAGDVQLRWDQLSGYLGSSSATRSKIRIVEWNPSASQWEYRGKVLTDGSDISGTVATDNTINLAPGTDLHYLTIGDEGLPTATITSPLTASICNDAVSSTTVTVALTGTPPWSLSYKLGSVTTTINNIATSPASIVLTSASNGINQPVASPTVNNINITNVSDNTGFSGITDYVTTVALTVNPIPSNTITGKTLVGTNEVVAYSTPSDASTYAWSLDLNGTLSNSTSANCTVTWGNNTPGPYLLSLIKTAANGCQVTNSVSVTTSTTPTPVISGDQKVCAGSSMNYSTPLVSGHSYSWSISPSSAGTITSGQNSNSCTIKWNSVSTGNSITVQESVTSTPTIHDDATILVDVGMQPSGTAPSFVTPVDPVCNGSSAAIKVNSSESGVYYQLRLDADNSNVGTAVAGNNGTIILNSTPISASTLYNINAYTLAPFNCSAQITNPTSNFTISSLTALDYGTVLSGDQTICSGSIPNSITFSVAPSGGTGTFNYQWYSYMGIPASCPTGTTVPSGWTVIPGATLNNYTLSSLSVSMSYAVMVTPTGSPSCGAATWANGCRKVTVNPTPVVEITNPAAVCTPTMVDLTVGSITNNSTPGLTFTYWTDAGTTSSLSNPDKVAISGTYYIKGTTSSGCFDIKPVVVVINKTPVTGPVYREPNN